VLGQAGADVPNVGAGVEPNVGAGVEPNVGAGEDPNVDGAPPNPVEGALYAGAPPYDDPLLNHPPIGWLLTLTCP
jgi:hypothetical protein